MADCPCGSGASLTDCCDKYISGKAPAPTAEALMRARYTSFAVGAIDFIERTHAPEGRDGFDRAAAEKWSRGSKWLGLKILATDKGREKDSEGKVRFVAAYEQDGKSFHHDEIASFRKDGANWLFVDGVSPRTEPFVKTGPDLGRNDPCHCGSGKKFKKCHGRPA